VLTEINVAKSSKSDAAGLFGEDDDSLFGGAKAPATKAAASKKAGGMFDDADDDLFGGAAPAPKAAAAASKGFPPSSR
jgi:hypothetical protein